MTSARWHPQTGLHALAPTSMLHTGCHTPCKKLLGPFFCWTWKVCTPRDLSVSCKTKAASYVNTVTCLSALGSLL